MKSPVIVLVLLALTFYLWHQFGAAAGVPLTTSFVWLYLVMALLVVGAAFARWVWRE
jgi:hypothetical protein